MWPGQPNKAFYLKATVIDWETDPWTKLSQWDSFGVWCWNYRSKEALLLLGLKLRKYKPGHSLLKTFTHYHMDRACNSMDDRSGRPKRQHHKFLNTAIPAAAAKSLQSCPTLCDPIDGSPPGSPIPGILQARTLEWVAMPSSRGSSRPRDRTHVSCVFCFTGRLVTVDATREAQVTIHR